MVKLEHGLINILLKFFFCSLYSPSLGLRLLSVFQALKMVMEKENWQLMPPDTIQVVSFPGLVGDGAALIVSSDRSPRSRLHEIRSVGQVVSGSKRGGFSYWKEKVNPFSSKLNGSYEEYSDSFHSNGSSTHGAGNTEKISQHAKSSSKSGDANHVNGTISEDENEDLHADFIDEDSQLPSRISKPIHSRHNSLHATDEDMTAQTGSSLSLLRYALDSSVLTLYNAIIST